MDFMSTQGSCVLADRHDNGHCKHCSAIVTAHLPFARKHAHEPEEHS